MAPDLVAMSGDCVDDPESLRDWTDFLEASAPLRRRFPYVVARGNHDRGENWKRAFATPAGESNYVLDFRHLRLVVADTERRTEPESEQGRWLKEELEKARARPFTVVMTHKPVISSGDYYTEDDSAESEDAKLLGRLFREAGVDLSISGHEHFYERLEEGGLAFVVSGGAGQALRDPTAMHPASRAFARARHACRLLVRADRIEFAAIGLDGKVLDEVTVRPR
jgi:3',5'-cyclic AMP phosphodiesterase CpdA